LFGQFISENEATLCVLLRLQVLESILYYLVVFADFFVRNLKHFEVIWAAIIVAL